MLERRGEWAKTELPLEIRRVRKLVSDEVRYIEEHLPPLLNPFPFPL